MKDLRTTVVYLHSDARDDESLLKYAFKRSENLEEFYLIVCNTPFKGYHVQIYDDLQNNLKIVKIYQNAKDGRYIQIA